jgi:hypothetical protein
VRGSLPYQAVVFLGSFLTFSLELAVAKMLLPRFGGSAYVWTTCVMFFQGLLLAGYGWGHAALARWGARRYSRVHLALLLAPFFFFPLKLPAPLPGAGPLADLLWALLRSSGAPFLVLSTTILVVQGWLTSSALADREDAYFLFAASNLGALAALGAYPLVIEPLLPLRSQSILWFGLYSVYAVLHLWCLPSSFSAAPAAAEKGPAPSGRERALWLLLSAAPCAAMLATTNLLTFDFAAVPLLWTAPLAVYLATFVLNFKRSPWYPGRMNSAVLPVLGLWVAVCLAAAALAVSRSADSTPVQTLRRLIDIGKFGYVTAALFIVGMICHKSLAASRPRAEGSMTEFYSWVAAGGLLGSLCIVVLVPWLGRGVAVLSLDWLVAGAVAAAALGLRDWDALSRRRGTLGFAALALSAAALGLRSFAPPDGVVRALRNFYGIYRVVDKDGTREFFHGNTDHGMQSLDPAKAGVPLTYYNLHSPLAEAYAALGADWRSVGVVGLGAGAIAAYGRAGQTMDFYELDPDVAMIAQTDFTYLKTSPARIRIVLGDARQSLARDESASYDLLILDAFNSGAVPIHLVTKEALELYLKRVPATGVILLHVSNRYLDLRSMLAASARDLGLAGACKRLTQSGRMTDDRVPSSWVALSRDPAKMRLLVSRQGWTDLADPAFGRGTAWTDQHASLLPVLAL